MRAVGTRDEKQKEKGQMSDQHIKDANASIFLAVARKIGLSVELLAARNSFLAISDGTKRLLVYHNATSISDVATRRMTNNKSVCQRLFRQHGIPVPEFKTFARNRIDAILDYWEQHRPIVIKPIHGSRSVGVTVNPQTKEEVLAALAIISGTKVMIEHYVPGDDYRILIFQDRILDIIKWLPPQVIGDGHRTIEQLIEEKNHYLLENDLYPIEIDPATLNRQNLAIADIPPCGHNVIINATNEHFVGAETIRVAPQEFHPDNLAMFRRAARLTNLTLSGLDFICRDPRLSFHDSGAMVNEINNAPHIWPHFHADRAQDTSCIEAILRGYFGLFDEASSKPAKAGATDRHGERTRLFAKTAGIVRDRWTALEKSYYCEALTYYQEVVFIDSRLVTYRLERSTGRIVIDYLGLPLNDLAMLYTFGRAAETQLLVRSLASCGCPTSDPYATIARDGLGKLADALSLHADGLGTTTHIITANELAERYLTHLDEAAFPLLNKPISGNKGKGIVLLTTAAEAIAFSAEHFKKSTEWLVFEQLMPFAHEYRIYVVDGTPIEGYEKVGADGKIVKNLAQGATPKTIPPEVKDDLFSWLSESLPQRYRTGIYGVDLGVTGENQRHFIEINRTPGFGGLKRLRLVNFPNRAHQIISRRAGNAAPHPQWPNAYRITMLGDTNPGETYQERRALKGQENILQQRGYRDSFNNFTSFLKESHYTVINLEAAVTRERRSPFAGDKPYCDRTDSEKTPATLNEIGIHAVSLANNHTFDFGTTGLLDTLKALNRHGISWFGAGLEDDEARRPLHHRFILGGRSLHLIIAAGFEHQQRQLERNYYAGPDNAGVNRWSVDRIREQLGTLRSAHPEAFLLAFPHWGSNYRYVLERQREMARAMIDAGADLIIGHGSHMLQEIECHQGRWIIYSVGNFVYNSPGRFASNEVVPYGLLCRLSIVLEQDGPRINLRLYPIHSDNRKTDYRPHFVTMAQFKEILALLMPTGKSAGGLERQFRCGVDHHGYYLVRDIRWEHASPAGTTD